MNSMAAKNSNQIPSIEELKTISDKAIEQESIRRTKEALEAYNFLIKTCANNLKNAAKNGLKELRTDIATLLNTPGIDLNFYKTKFLEHLISKGYGVETIPCTKYHIRISW